MDTLQAIKIYFMHPPITPVENVRFTVLIANLKTSLTALTAQKVSNFVMENVSLVLSTAKFVRKPSVLSVLKVLSLIPAILVLLNANSLVSHVQQVSQLSVLAVKMDQL